MELTCSVQKYEWGKLGDQSKVATFYKNTNPDFSIESTTPYAEFWMGTHPNGPATIKSTGQSLLSYIEENPQLLGEDTINLFGKDLPFLFKVLSVNKALSIQAHPAKKHAEELHALRPDLYKDPNHKPELAIALTPFEAMCGFRPITEIQTFCEDVPELCNVLGPMAVKNLLHRSDFDSSYALKTCFQALMTCSEEVITTQLTNMLQRFLELDKNTRNKQLAPLVERLYAQFPNDVGCFAVYFLNIITLQPYEALFLGPNEPHAYLSGDCVECMACSDNVVRAGLTPKYKDVETLCSMLIYKGDPGCYKLFKPIAEDQYCQIFKPPVPDFAVAKIEVPKIAGTYTLIERRSASILLLVAGSCSIDGTPIQPGSVLFLPAHKTGKITDIQQNVLLFQAMANI